MKRAIVVLFCVLFAVGAFSQRVKENGVVVDKTAQGIVDKIAKNIQTESPLRITFSMTTQSKGKQIAAVSGTFLSDGERFRLLYEDGEDYCDGKNVWHFVKSTGEVELSAFDAESNLLNIAQMVRSYAKDYRPKLIREEQKGSATLFVIDLIPKGKSSISKIRILSDKATNRLKEMTINIRGGNSYVYKFSKYETKVKVQPSDFTFPKSKYPKAEIIDLR